MHFVASDLEFAGHLKLLGGNPNGVVKQNHEGDSEEDRKVADGGAHLEQENDQQSSKRRRPWSQWPVHYLCWEISTGLELFEEGGHEEGGEKEDSGPEENVWSVWTVVATRRPDELSMQVDTLLLKTTEEVLA